MKTQYTAWITGFFCFLILLTCIPDASAQRRRRPSPRVNKPSQQVKPKKCERVRYRSGRVVHYCSKGDVGDLISYTFDRDNSSYSAINYTQNTVERGGKYSRYFDDQGNDILEFKRGLKTYYAVESKQQFLATNFPGGVNATMISSGINTEVDNYLDFEEFDGEYLYFILDLNDRASMTWGVAEFWSNEDQETGEFFMTEYNTRRTLPHQLTWDKMFDDLDSPNAVTGSYEVDPNAKSAFDMYFQNASGGSKYDDIYLPGTGYSGYNGEAVIIADLGLGNGYFQAVKVSEFPDPADEYGYVQSDIDFGSGGGFFTLLDNATRIRIEHKNEYGQEELSDTYKLNKSPDIPGLYYADLDDAERLYLFISGDFAMHFTINKITRALLNYGVGADMTE